MFHPELYDSGKLVNMACANAQAITKGAALADNGSGYLALATSSTAVDVKYVAMEDVTTTADGQKVLCLRTPGVIFVADTDANPAQTDVGTYCDLATDSTLNPDASTNDLFYIESIVGPVADKKVRGWFIEGVPNS